MAYSNGLCRLCNAQGPLAIWGPISAIWGTPAIWGAPRNLRGPSNRGFEEVHGAHRRSSAHWSPRTLLRHCIDSLYIMPISVILRGVFQRKRIRWTVELATYFSMVLGRAQFRVTWACLRVSGLVCDYTHPGAPARWVVDLIQGVSCVVRPHVYGCVS